MSNYSLPPKDIVTLMFWKQFLQKVLAMAHYDPYR